MISFCCIRNSSILKSLEVKSSQPDLGKAGYKEPKQDSSTDDITPDKTQMSDSKGIFCFLLLRK